MKTKAIEEDPQLNKKKTAKESQEKRTNKGGGITRMLNLQMPRDTTPKASHTVQTTKHQTVHL